MLKPFATVVITAMLATGLTAVPAQARHNGARHFPSCAAMQRVYPHGVGLRGAVDRTSGTRVTNYKRSRALYLANNGPRNQRTREYDLDRDNDRIACEKR